MNDQEESESVQRAKMAVANGIARYRQNRLDYYSRLKLEALLRKDPLIPALRGIDTATAWCLEMFHAHESSSEEGAMGSAWQAILGDLTANAVGAGDFFFEKDGLLWVIEIKSQTNTFSDPARVQTLKALRQKVREQTNVRVPGRRGVRPAIGIVRGVSRDEERNHHTNNQEDREIDGFQYRYLVGAAFLSWLTGFDNPAAFVDVTGGDELALARQDCLNRLTDDLLGRLLEKQLEPNIGGVIKLISDT